MVETDVLMTPDGMADALFHPRARALVYDGCNRGWCVKGAAVYNEAGAAERAWPELTALDD